MENLISLNDFCASHNIEISFIHSLTETGLIETSMIEETGYIPENQLPELEKIVRMYFELNINFEGIETINHLLHRLNAMQDEITWLRNRLRFYETDEESSLF